MRVSPCKSCDRKGCGSYHDECKEYLEWKEECKTYKKPPEYYREFIKETTYKSRKSGQFRNHKK